MLSEMKPMMLRWSIVIGVCALLSGAVNAQENARDRPDLSGDWVLNRDLSADPRQAEEGRRGREPGDDPGGRGGPGGRMPGRFGGGRRGVPGGVGPGDAGDDRTMREQMDEAQRVMRDAPNSMTIVHTDPKVVFLLPDGRIRTLYTDKRKVKTANGNAELQARWDGNRVVVETKFGSIKVIETYAMSEGGQQLIVTAKMDLPDGGRSGRAAPELRRVYER